MGYLVVTIAFQLEDIHRDFTRWEISLEFRNIVAEGQVLVLWRIGREHHTRETDEMVWRVVDVTGDFEQDGYAVGGV